MTKENVINLLQSVLVVVGAFLIGKNLLGNEIDQVLWVGIVGVVLTVVGFVWDIATTKVTIEYFQTGLMTIAQFLGGLLISSGKLSSESANTYYGFLSTLIGILYPILSRKKTTDLATGEIKLVELKGATDETATPNDVVITEKI